MATGYIHIGTMAGKLNGVMPTQTPSGWRNEKTSTPVETWSEKSPLSSVGMPQANSITSRPRCTSPRASETTLPCSSEIASASRWMLALTSSRKVNSTLVRCESDDWPHRSNAAFAVRTAVSTSSALASATSACCSPVAGFQTGLVRSEDPVAGLPPIQCVMVLNGPPPSRCVSVPEFSTVLVSGRRGSISWPSQRVRTQACAGSSQIFQTRSGSGPAMTLR